MTSAMTMNFFSSVMSILAVFLEKSQKSDFFEWLIQKRNVVLWATSKILLFNGAKCIHSSLFLEQSQFSFAIFRTFIEPVLHTHTQKKLQWLKYIKVCPGIDLTVIMIGWTEILRVHIKNQIKEKCMNYFVHIFTTSIVIFSDEGVVFLQSKYYIIHCSDYFVLQTLVFWRLFFPFSPQLVIPVEWKSLKALVKAPQSDNLLFDRTDRTYCNHIVYYSINLTFHRMHSESLIMQELQPKVRVGLVLYLTKGLDNLFYPNKGL